jgi:hypothetical protein
LWARHPLGLLTLTALVGWAVTLIPTTGTDIKGNVNPSSSAPARGDILRARSGREPPERLVRLVYDETEFKQGAHTAYASLADV